MKLSLRSFLVGALGAAALSLSPFAVSSAQPDNQEIDLDAHRVQIVHAPGTNADYTNFNLTFTNNGDPACEEGDDAIASGVFVAIAPGTCESIICGVSTFCQDPTFLMGFPFEYDIEPFVPHTVGGHTYGTFLGLNPVGVGPGIVSARIGLLSPSMSACGTWNLNVQATGLDLSSITANPIALLLNDADGSGPFCFDINDAIIGTPINPHPTPVGRRGGRRAGRR